VPPRHHQYPFLGFIDGGFQSPGVKTAKQSVFQAEDFGYCKNQIDVIHFVRNLTKNHRLCKQIEFFFLEIYRVTEYYIEYVFNEKGFNERQFSGRTGTENQADDSKG
jgi:hypothetical protein